MKLTEVFNNTKSIAPTIDEMIVLLLEAKGKLGGGATILVTTHEDDEGRGFVVRADVNRNASDKDILNKDLLDGDGWDDISVEDFAEGARQLILEAW